MRRRNIIFANFIARLFTLSILLSVSACAQTQQTKNQKQAAERIAIRAARMLDVREGRLINDAVILVEGDKITAAGARLNIPPDTKIIDLGDATILPGLIDAHTHITYHFDENGMFGASGDANLAETMRYAKENARLTVESGITTIRNLAAYGTVDLQLRDAVRRGEVIGPRMIVSGEPLTSYNLRGVTKSDERIERIRDFVKARASEGADVIKIFEGVDSFGAPIFSAKEIRAAVEEAARANLKVAVHAHEAAAVKAAVEGGCASIEHGTFMDDEAIRLMVKNKTALVPTLYLPTHYLEHRKQFIFDESTWEFFEKLKSQNIDNLRKARKAGVFVVAGSDAVAGLHGHNVREIIWMTKAGMKPAEAIRAATLDAAKLLRLENQIGELKAGEFADIVAAPGNPLEDINSLERIEFVMASGKIIKTK